MLGIHKLYLWALCASENQAFNPSKLHKVVNIYPYESYSLRHNTEKYHSTGINLDKNKDAEKKLINI